MDSKATALDPVSVEYGFYWARAGNDLTIVEKLEEARVVHFRFLGSEEIVPAHQLAEDGYVLLGRIIPPDRHDVKVR